MLMNLERRRWDAGMLSMLEIPIQMLPEIVPSSDPSAYGVTAAATPCGPGIPITAALGDQQAALVGQVCLAPGAAKNTYGTGSFVLLNTGPRPVTSEHGLVTTVGYDLGSGPSAYAIEGSIAVTGAAVGWLRDNLGIIRTAEESEQVAAEVEDCAGVYFVPALSGLFAPHWDMYARGTIVGLTQHSDHRHLVRATLESICYQTRDVVEAMVTDSGAALRSLRVDGGASRNNLLMQMQADILGAPVVRPTVTETTALGAAYAGGLAIGLWQDIDELRSFWTAEATFQPTWSDDRRQEACRLWARAVQRAGQWLQA